MTMKDIAALAGVSVGTVSRALNGKPGLKLSTKEKILRIAGQLNYFPNAAARTMKSRRTNTLGLVVPDITNPFYSYTTKTIESIARRNNYTVMVFNTDNKQSVQTAVLQTLRSRQVDGMILGSVSLRDTQVEEIIQEGIPLIMYHRHLEGYKGNCIGCDNAIGVRLAIKHLFELGHSRIAFISGPRTFSTGMERLKTYLEMMTELGLKITPALLKQGGYDRKTTNKSVLELLALPASPTAIFAANDLMALQVIDCILTRGYSVPEDISVVGFDNIAIAAHSRIGLTTVDVRPEECAKLTIEKMIYLLERRKHTPEQITILLEPELIVRSSTAPPAK